MIFSETDVGLSRSRVENVPLDTGGGDVHLLFVGLDLTVRNRALDAVDDDPIIGLDARFDHPEPTIDLPDDDRALLDDVVLVDDQQIAAELVAAARGVGTEQRRLRTPDRDPDARKYAGQQPVV